MLMRQLSLDLMFFRQLAKGNDDRLLTLLTGEYNGQLRCLTGILTLTGGAAPRNVPGALPDHSLSRCFDHALRRLGAWHLRSADPVYGPVFQDLARETEHHCRCITELLGSSKEVTGQKRSQR